MKAIGIGISFGLLLLFAAGPLKAQQVSKEGIHEVEEKTKTVVYKIKVEGLHSQADADRLDQEFLRKEVVLTAHTDAETQVSTVEVLRKCQPRYLGDVVHIAGFEVAKAFED